MELAQLEYLISFCKEGDRAKAARKSHVTPQAISKSISALENELGIELAEKSGRAAVPTKHAQVLASKAEIVLCGIVEMKSYAHEAKLDSAHSGHITVGLAYSPYRGCPLNEASLISFERTHTSIALAAEHYLNESCVSILESNFVDLAIVPERPENTDFMYSQIPSVPIACALSKRNQLSRKDSISLEDIASMPIARSVDANKGHLSMKSFLQSNGLEPHYEYVDIDLDCHHDFLTKGGAIIAFSNSRISKLFNDVAIVPITKSGNKLTCPTYLVYKREKETSPLPLLVKHLQEWQA